MTDSALAALGIAAGDRVRFRRGGGRWKEAVVERREKDGSIGLRDAKGSSRSIPVDQLEVRTNGPRGAPRWESLTERAARTEQMRLL